MADTITKSFILESAPGVRWTGQAANLNFRVSPYATPGNVIAGLTFTETPASSGVYVVTGSTDFYENVKCYVSTTEITSLGIFDFGDPDHKYIQKGGGLAFTANQPMGGFKVTGAGAATTNGDLTRWEQTGVIDQVRTISNTWTFTTLPISTNAPTLPNHIPNKTYVDRLNLVNKIIVDPDAAGDIAGIVYTTISAAMTYIQSLGTRSTTNRFNLVVYPKKSGVITDAFIWYDWINIHGVGEVVLRNTDTFSLFVRSGTTDTPKATNIIFTQGDLNLDFHKVNCQGGGFVAVDGLTDFGQIQFGTSQFKNFGFFYDYADGYLIDDGSNKILSGCYGNSPIAWNGSTDVMDYKYQTGLTLTY